MLKQYNAKIIGENPNIEEELVIDVDGNILVCFVENYRYKINIGKSYPITLEATVLDDLEINILNNENKNIIRVNDSFSYYLQGMLDITSKTIDVGVEISLDDEDLSDYRHLHNKFVEIKIDRINIIFL